jgi:aspartate kinase
VESASQFRNGDKDKGFATLQLVKNKFEQTANELFKDESTKSSIPEYLELNFEVMMRKINFGFTEETEKWLIIQGEIITSQLFTLYLQEQRISATLVDAENFMRLNAQGEPDLPLIINLLSPLVFNTTYKIFVTQGFVCQNHRGETDNLKRGGSDYSATLIGAALQAKIIEIWTDIDGMQNNDPRVVEETFPVRSLSFDEAAELAYFGAKILHPACVWPAQKFNIPIWLRNTMHPENPGTVIGPRGTRKEITAIAAKDHITAIRIKSGRMLNTYGFLVQVFRIFEDFKTPIDMITTSEISVSVTIDNNTFLEDIVKALQGLGTVDVDTNQTIICVVGDFLVDKYGHAARILHSLHNIPVRMISYGGSQNNISILVSTTDKKRSLNKLNSGLFLTIPIADYAFS